MARPSLEEIFASQPQQTDQRPSLDEIFSQPPQQNYQTQPQSQLQQQQRPSLNEIFGQQPASQPPDNTEQSGIMDVLGNIGSAIKEPAATALEALSYLDKPRGAIAGAVRAYQHDQSILEGAQKGWNDNTSWKETFDPQWVKDNPTAAAIAGFATDVALDPLWVATPAKAVGMLAKGSKAVGLTDKVVNPLVKTVEESDLGKNLIAKAQDATGYNRLSDVQGEFKAGRATDQVVGQDTIDEINNLVKDNPGIDATALTKYVEAKPIEPITVGSRQTERNAVISGSEDGSLVNDIKSGAVNKEEAFNILRDENKTIPDYLLQEPQRIAKEVGQTIPDYVHREDVLNSIPDTNIRNQIQAIGDRIVSLNKQRSGALLGTGRLSDKQYVRFMEGSHLRRSFDQYETPEKFLEAVRKNGTPEEWQRVYTDYQTAQKGGNGFGVAHKVNMKDFTGRQVLSDETLAKMGVINDPAYKVMDTFNRGSKTLREDEFLTKVNQMFGKSEEEAALLSRSLPKSREYVPVPDTKGYGSLAGKWVPADVAKQVMGTLGQRPDSLNNAYGKLVSWWKVEKLANPASVMRNFYSGLPMANVFGNVPMYSLPKQMGKVIGQFASQGGKNSPLIRELRQTGILGNIWNKQELGNIIGDHPTGIKKLADKGMKAFGAPDQFWRAVVYSYHRDAGKSIKEAAKIANRALFDYSAAPDWVNWFSKSGAMPFAKFPYFAAKETARSAYNNPAQVTKYTKAQSQVNNNDRESIMPDYLKAKTLLPLTEGERIVNGKPQKIQNNLDLSYILPFANDMTLGNPAIDALGIMRTGKNSIGQQVIKPGMTTDEKGKQWANWAFNALGPSLPLPGNYAGDKLYNAYKGNVDSKGRQYDMPSAVAQSFFGLKNVPVSEEELFKQKVAALTTQQRDIKAMMNQIAKDQSLTREQKTEQISDHQSQLRQLGKQLKTAGEAWQREKKRGAN